jgi:hypothetical protein
MVENNPAAANDVARQLTVSPILCLAIGTAVGFFAFMAWLLLTAFA